MTPLPPAYAWLDQIANPPQLIATARALYGTHETPGPANNPVIMGWAKELGLERVYTDDSKQAWCGLFAAWCCHTNGKLFPSGPLWALNWQRFGQLSPEAALGDVLVFTRKDAQGHAIGGHVGFYVAEDDEAYHVLGGNEGDQVNIVRVPKSRCVAVRRPIWSIAQPASVQPHHVAPTGALSASEA